MWLVATTSGCIGLEAGRYMWAVSGLGSAVSKVVKGFRLDPEGSGNH